MKTIKLREYQKDAYVTASGRSRLLVNMPTGWGKSVLVTALAASDLKGTTRKIVICVPQRVIAKGFRGRKTFSL